MTETLPCLVRIGDNVKKYKLFILDKDEISIGRSEDVTYCIMSGMISRCHVFIKKTEGVWTIKDNKSLNGVFINGKKLDSQNATTLNDGDVIQLGVRNTGDKQEFIYRFSMSAKVKRARRESDDSVSCKPVKKRFCPDNVDGSEGDSKMKEFQERLEEMQKILKEKELEHVRMKEALEKEKEEKVNQGKLLDDLKEKEVQLKSELQIKQVEMQTERKELEKKMHEELETQLKEREKGLIEKLRVQQDSLMTEKTKVEESLKQEMEKALEEKNKQLEIELTQQRDKLEKVIASKELEQKVLESQLNETKAENIKTKEAMLSAREDVLNNFKDLMEVELQCSICSELFIQSTSLNCSHSFCALCIEQWMAVKKECPICRAPITSHMRSIVLDSYIDKMVEQLDDDMRLRRKELVTTRKEEQKKIDAKKVTAGGSGRGRARGRGRGRGRNTSRRAAASPATPSRRPIVISDEEEESDDYDDDVDGDNVREGDRSTDSDDSEDDTDSEGSNISGDPDAYYGGYGRCYSCGRSGHWANGCPDS
ncbi:hypothetical protein SNE40_009843 [Patella caerulea]|uniref:E3 ubiquitin-protein ligase CHFR n=1 Tax=Patella caerulea TaxID=87958 RepID=A0AAN8JU50_PATCE